MSVFSASLLAALLLFDARCDSSDGRDPQVQGPGQDAGTSGPDREVADSGSYAPDLASDLGAGDRDAGRDLGPEPVDGSTDVRGEDAETPVDPVACLGEADLTAITEAWTHGTIVKTAGKGFLAAMPTQDGDLYLPVLRGSYFQMGCQYAYLVSQPLCAVWNDFLTGMIGDLMDLDDLGMPEEQVLTLVEEVMDLLWQMMLPLVPEEFLQELDGMAAGQKLTDVDPSVVHVQRVVTMMTALSNISDSGSIESLEDIVVFIESGHSPAFDEYFAPQEKGTAPKRARRRKPRSKRLDELLRDPRARAILRGIRIPRHSCSIMGAWGDSTRNGHLLAMRNLDWNADTGMNRLKAVTFWVPDEGLAQATIGYLGFQGAMSGISEAGVVTGEVGSTGVLERLQGTPWTLKHRETLMKTADLDEALALITNTRDDGQERPPTIGYNWLVAWGDPANRGSGAHAAVVETTGIFTAVHRQQADCAASTTVYEYDLPGAVASVTTNRDDPLLANLEADAVEIDATGTAKLFLVDEAGQLVEDGSGHFIPDAAGSPLPVGKPLACALFRGDGAMAAATRRWQQAANGPQGDPDRLLVDSGSYRHRYSRIHGMLAAYRSGRSFEEDGELYVPDHEGMPVAMTLDEAVAVARAAAMGGNIHSVAYDATALTLRVAYESGAGDTWKPADENEYYLIDAGAIFELVRGPQ